LPARGRSESSTVDPSVREEVSRRSSAKLASLRPTWGPTASRARARLAVGDAVGRGGSFADDFRLTSSRATGSTVLLTMKPKQREGFVLSALYDGPVIFATC
jgi:hypothetical protein